MISDLQNDLLYQRCEATIPVILVATVDTVDAAVSIAKTVHRAGIGLLEITLRSPAGLDAIRCVRQAVPQLCVGAGTIRSVEELRLSSAAGAQFLVSPGITPALLKAGINCSVPFVPGIASVSEALLAREAGYRLLKFFPAETAGGTEFLNHTAAVLPDIHFCPTGGIIEHNLRDYLSCKNVLCIGGSWIAPPSLVRSGDWNTISARVQNVIKACHSLHT